MQHNKGGVGYALAFLRGRFRTAPVSAGRAGWVGVELLEEGDGCNCSTLISNSALALRFYLFLLAYGRMLLASLPNQPRLILHAFGLAILFYSPCWTGPKVISTILQARERELEFNESAPHCFLFLNLPFQIIWKCFFLTKLLENSIESEQKVLMWRFTFANWMRNN